MWKCAINVKRYMEKDKEFFVQGYARVPIVLTEGNGAILKDIEGKEYIDCFAGISVSNVGHAHKRLVKAGTEQMSKLIHTSGRFYNIPQTYFIHLSCERYTCTCSAIISCSEWPLYIYI